MEGLTPQRISGSSSGDRWLPVIRTVPTCIRPVPKWILLIPPDAGGTPTFGMSGSSTREIGGPFFSFLLWTEIP